jgi:hypothetical protein
MTKDLDTAVNATVYSMVLRKAESDIWDVIAEVGLV